VREFQQMILKNRIELPTGVTNGTDEAGMNKMIDTALGLEPLWKNALGENWKQLITRDKIRSLYEKM
jgi:3-deoxy-alpha-D-manno-octulosonate 8-oxidase